MNEIFVKRYPSKGEFPKEKGYYHVSEWGPYRNDVKSYPSGLLYDNTSEEVMIHWKHVEYWLEEKTLPSDEEIDQVVYDELKSSHDIVFSFTGAELSGFVSRILSNLGL